MIAPTNIYKNAPTLSPEEAADMVAQACIFKAVRIASTALESRVRCCMRWYRGGPNRNEYEFLPHVPGFQRGQGVLPGARSTEAAAISRGGSHAANDAPEFTFDPVTLRIHHTIFKIFHRAGHTASRPVDSAACVNPHGRACQYWRGRF